MIVQSKPWRESREDAVVAKVSESSEDGISAVGVYEYRGVPVFLPPGMTSLPALGDRVLLIPVEGGYLCAGVQARDCIPNELSLSSGGSEIRLKSGGELSLSCGNGKGNIRMDTNGSVEINGVVITPEGKLFQKEG